MTAARRGVTHFEMIMPTMLPPLLLLLAAIVPIVAVSPTTVERFGLYEGSLPGVVASVSVSCAL